ncbi:alpha-latrotoxin-Lh1a-like [Parasteatoda tepidariorum]|uniref:alpha-latrotoxin-Lh1a-like n=1 Tax=Parasteatoda tepidariorum TaxID=114398 RepID=UPI001C721C5B|nr:alpha-latrotoxin-Lh1a-like [Parasteatoda tepidariorum]XP_042897770.1 alpha-latrotoxin-Lh1a-like [Parasteatoda tepidariorum]XP_042897771.1 alpha-latrotoxin-Lh1a-like [Parasteatoda tepidariorum]
MASAKYSRYQMDELSVSSRIKRETSKVEQCKAMEIGSKVSSTASDIVNDLNSIPIVGEFLGVFTAGISVVSHLFSGGLDIAQTAVDCGDVPFDEIKEIMNRRFNEIDRRLDEQTAALREIRTLANKTLISVEQTRLEMHARFDEVIETIEITQVDPIISKINNFVQYFYTESERIKGLNNNDYVNRLADGDDNFLKYLSDYRTPDGLLSFLLNIIKLRYATPKTSYDKAAFKAIDALIYGSHTYVTVMFFLIEQYAYLVNYFLRISDVDNYNRFLNGMINTFKYFRRSLIGRGIAGKEEPLLLRVIELLQEVNNLDFVWATKARRLTDSIRLFESIKLKVQNMTLPAIEEEPQNFVQFSFKKNIKTPIGDWVAGKRVSYAVQYKSDDKYAKIGEWSHPVLVQERACPTLKVPIDKLRRDRLVFRRFLGETPKLIGTLKSYETEFTDINRDFYDAVDSPDKESGMRAATILLREGADTNAMFENGRRALHAAAKWGNTEIALSLLLGKPYSEKNARDKNGFTPMHVAVEAGQEEFMNLLIRHRSTIGIQSYPQLLTPLHLAARNGFVKTLETLLTNTVDLNVKDMSGFTPLHNAVVGGEQVVNMIVNTRKASINAQSNTKLTPFHLAVINNDMKVAQSLINSKEVNINAGDDNNMTPLHHAAMMGHLDMVNYLLALEGIEINEGTNDNKWAPIHYAIFFRKDNVSKRLLEDGRLKLRTVTNGWLTALHFAVTYGRKDVLLAIIKRGVLIDQQTQEGYSSLHLAAMRETPDMLNILIQNKADINAKTFKNSTPLHEAAFRGRIENVLVLLDKNADLHARDDMGNTPIHKAALNGAVSVVDLLLKRDKSLLELKNHRGETPLHMASQNMHSAVVKFLRNKGANVDVSNSDGETPIHMYAKGGQLHMIEYLISNGGGLYVTDSRTNDFMYYAIQNGHIDVVKYGFERERYIYDALVKTHIPPRCPKSCPWVFCDANQFDQLEMIKYFFDKINPKDCVLLNEAALYGHLDIVKYFIQERNANIEKESPTAYPPLCSAAQSGHLHIVKYMIEKDASAKGECGSSGFLNRATQAEVDSETRVEIIKLLVMKGADINHRDEGGQLPIHHAIFLRDLVTADYFIEDLGVSVNEPTANKLRNTPLHMAVQHEYFDVVKYLVEKGADMNAKNNKNETPFDIALGLKSFVIGNYLKSKMNRSPRNLAASVLNNTNFNTGPSNFIEENDHNSFLQGDNKRDKTFHRISNFNSLQDFDVIGTLLLLNVFVRKFTGEKYINTANQTNFEDDSTVEGLRITENLQRFLNSRPTVLPEEKIDFYDVYSSIKRAMANGSNSKLHKILCRFVEEYDMLTPEEIQELLNVHIGKERIQFFKKAISLKSNSFINLWHSATETCFTVDRTTKSLDM